MAKPSLELKVFGETAINTPTLDEYKTILRAFNCGGWMVSDIKYSGSRFIPDKKISSEPSNEYFRFAERMEELNELGVEKSDMCIQVGNLYDTREGLVHLGDRGFYKKVMHCDIITPMEFFKEENISDSQINEINSFFDKKEGEEQFEFNENYKLKPLLKLKLTPLNKTVINIQTEKEYKDLLRVFHLGGWMRSGFHDCEPEQFYRDFKQYKSETCEEAENLINGGSHVVFDTEWHRRFGRKIISLKEFYNIQGVTNFQIKKINDFFDKDEYYRGLGWRPKEENSVDVEEVDIDELKVVEKAKKVVIEFPKELLQPPYDEATYNENYKKIKEIKESILNSPLSKKIFYTTENGEEVDLSKLNPGWIQDEEFKIGHKNFVFGCHDVLLEYNDGLLLIIRDNVPAKDVLWPIGGNYKKGVDSKKSLAKKVKEECNLEIEGEPIYLGDGRTAFQTDPWGHGHGTDTTNERYFAHAKGELKLNELHKNPVIVKPKDYTPEFRKGLEQYVIDFMDISMIFMDDMDPVLLNSYLNESLLKK